MVPEKVSVTSSALTAQAITAALPKLRAATAGRGLATGAYANGFQRTTSDWLAASGAPLSGAVKGDGGTSAEHVSHIPS